MNVNNKIIYIQSILLSLESLEVSLADHSVQIKLNDLIDTVKYSDPMSHESLKDLESTILVTLDELKEAVLLGDFTLALGLMNDMNALFMERNKKCKLLK